MDNDNIVKFGTVEGGKPAEDDIPMNDYVIVDNQGREFYHTGFLLFTGQHVAIMQERGGHTVPVFMMPLSNLGVVEVLDDEEVN
jgi:hypothetical protein